MKVRDYQTEDCERCLALFDSNVPRFFAPHERAEFAEFLATSTDPYFVVTDNQGQIIGCGGYYLNRERATAGLTWGMVSNHLHRQGIGRFLLLARLRRLSQEPTITSVFINTSQHSYGFFAKVGFVVEAIVENGFAPGLHEYKMILPLSSETRQRLLTNL
ncbi:MAG: GNAT family N-acetyltransferase [Caldilinea sp. CFX5]|nr:GNAT family N-acetyltransferase [Caldilinea sp. CFX5]